MMSGDGLVMRLRPRLARFTRTQILVICEAASRHAAGLIDLTSRANLQLRGVAEADWPLLCDVFAGLGLLDDSVEREARRNLLVAPDWKPGDDTERIATELIARLDELPDLPAKVGFAIDAGAGLRLRHDSADFRIERGAHGGLILRAQGRVSGVAVAAAEAADALIALAHWFADSGGRAAGRMARHVAALPAWAAGNLRPAADAWAMAHESMPGPLFSLPFGQVAAATLARAVGDSGAVAVRITPWRKLLLEGAQHDTGGGLLASGAAWVEAASAAGWRVEACAGAPFCPQASVATRPLALRLLRLAAEAGQGITAFDGRQSGGAGTPQRVLHVAGCAKACAYAGEAAITAVGRAGVFDLSLREGAPTRIAGLNADAVLARCERVVRHRSA